MNKALQTLFDALRHKQRIHSGSLIITVFGDAILPRGGKIWLGSLIRLLEPLGINERLVRTTVFRLSKDEWLQTETVGRRANYGLSATGRLRCEEAATRLYASRSPVWDRRWRLFLQVGALDAKLREQLRAALSSRGFGVLGDECFVHPSADMSGVLDSLSREGFGEVLASLLPMLAADLRTAISATDADLVGKAWDLRGLAAAYQSFADAYQKLLDVSRQSNYLSLSAEDAFVLRTLLIHDYQQLLICDPCLPDELLPAGWPGQQARLLCRELYKRFESLGDEFLDQHLCLADGSQPAIDCRMPPRFPLDDPLWSWRPKQPLLAEEADLLT